MFQRTTIPQLFKNDTTITSHTHLDQFLDDVDSGAYKDIIANHRQKVDDAVSKGHAKPDKPTDLPAILPHLGGSVIGDSRKCVGSNNLIRPDASLSGIFSIDIDKLTEGQVSSISAHLDGDEQIYAYFVSPSGNGIKLFGFHDLQDVDLFRDVLREFTFDYITRVLGLKESNYDSAPTIINSLCYMSHGKVSRKDDYLIADFISIGDLVEEKHKKLTIIDQKLTAIAAKHTKQGNVDRKWANKSEKLNLQLAFTKGSNNRSYAYGLTLRACGYDRGTIRMLMESFKQSCASVGRQAKWDVEKKVDSVMSGNIATVANTSTMSSIETAKYDELLEERTELSRSRVLKRATKVDVDVTVVPDDGFTTSDHTFMANENMLHLIDAYNNDNRKTLLLTNAGGGKTYAASLAIKALCKQHKDFKSVFLTHTIKNKKEWLDNNPFYYNVAGVYELLLGQLPHDMAEEDKKRLNSDISMAFKCRENSINEFNKLHKEDIRKGTVKSLSTLGLTTEVIRDLNSIGWGFDIVSYNEDASDNKSKSKGNHVTMTHAKWESMRGGISQYKDHFIIYDEINAITARPSSGNVRVWNMDIDVYWTKEMSQHTACLDNMKDMKVLFMTCERGVKHNLEGTFGKVHVLDRRVKLVDKKLTTVVVKGTGVKGGALEAVYDVLKEHNILAIGNSGGNISHLGVKGSNAYKENDTAVVISTPAAVSIAKWKRCCRIIDTTTSMSALSLVSRAKEEKINEELLLAGETPNELTPIDKENTSETDKIATGIIISNEINQSVGRNTGYRQQGSNCLLLVPSKYKDIIKQDTVGEFYDLSDTIPDDNPFKDVIDRIRGGFNKDAFLQNFTNGDRLKASELKKLIKEYCSLIGWSDRKIKQDSGSIYKDLTDKKTGVFYRATVQLFEFRTNIPK